MLRPVRHKIKEELDAARTDPIVFADQMPPGASSGREHMQP